MAFLPALQLVLAIASAPLPDGGDVPDTVLTADRAHGIERAVRTIDDILDVRDNRSRARTDSAFLCRAPELLRLKLTLNGSGSNLIVRGQAADGGYKSTLEAQNKYTVSMSASYRGLTLGFALNPAHLAGKNKDYEFNMNAYGNRMGADVIFQSANTFSGDIETARGTTAVPTGLVRQNMLYLNAYYALNARRFSYPAAFSQSWIQRRGSGSFMVGVSFMGGNLRVSHSAELGNTASRVSIANIGLGVGYGHNFVLRGRWLLHLSTLPQLVVASRNHISAGGAKEKAPYRFPNVMAVGRMAVVRHFDLWADWTHNGGEHYCYR